MTDARAIFSALEAAALKELDALYFRALTAQAKGEDAGAPWADFGIMLARVLILGNLVGRLGVVRSIRLAVPPEIPLAPSEALYAEDDDLIASPFVQALNFFVNKIPMVRKAVALLSPAAKSQAFWVTGVESREALARIQERLSRPLQALPPVPVVKPSGKIGSESPGGMGIFIREEEPATGLARARLETVYRTNVMGALAQGAKEQIRDPLMRSAVALMQLNEIHDTRTRGAPGTKNPGHHWQMDGFVESPDHPIWISITPPNGYQCRGNLTPIGWGTAERMGLAKEGALLQDALDAHNAQKWELIRAGKYPDPGFK